MRRYIFVLIIRYSCTILTQIGRCGQTSVKITDNNFGRQDEASCRFSWLVCCKVFKKYVEIKKLCPLVVQVTNLCNKLVRYLLSNVANS
jgi:predicted DNA-binding WGR domain protein